MFFSRSIRDLLKFKEEVTKERDQLLSEVVKLRECLAQTVEQQQEMERSREEAEQSLSQVCSEHGRKMKKRHLPEGAFVLPQSPFRLAPLSRLPGCAPDKASMVLLVSPVCFCKSSSNLSHSPQ